MANTKLTQVQAEVGSLHQAGVLTHGPNIEVHENWQAGECCHSEPHQEEQVGQEHQLQTQGHKIMSDRDITDDMLFNHSKTTHRLFIYFENSPVFWKIEFAGHFIQI